MDTHDIFRKLSVGAKFGGSLKRKNKDNPSRAVKNHSYSALDFFGDSPKLELEEQESVKPILGKHGREEVDSDDDESLSKSESGDDKFGDEGDDRKLDVSLKFFSSHEPVREKQGKVTKKRKKYREEEVKELLRREEANAFRNSHRIYVRGSDIPDAMESFQVLDSSYSLPPYILKNVVSMGYSEPTPIQMQVIPLMLQGREVLACAPTGSGKTAAFIIPIIASLKVPQRSGFRAVVVSPTRELAQQTYREFLRLGAGSGFRVHVLTKAKANENTFGSQSSQRFDILVTTPNRLVHMLVQEPPAIQLHNVEWLVLDESDKLFEDGASGFKEQVAHIYRSCDNPSIRHALFSATLASGVEEFCHTHLDSSVRVIIGLPNSATSAIRQELKFVGQEGGKLIAVRDIIRKGFSPPMLVFVQSRERAKELFQELIYDGLNVDIIHSERTQAQRDNVVSCFRAGKIWILICTDVMGRGIDFVGVNLVINYDFPPSAVSYIHRIGRTGRAGREGRSITFFTEDDAASLRSIANVMRTSGCEVPEWMLQLKKPSKNMRKSLSKKPVKRDSIKTVSKYDLQKSTKKKQMISASRRRTQTQ